MFKWLKKLLGRNKKDVYQEVHQEAGMLSESLFPPAEELLKETSEVWPTVSREEILKKMKCEVAKGERCACFFNALIDDETREELISRHYKVRPTTIGSSPGFVVYW